MKTAFESSIIRILDPGDNTIGAGFLVSANLLVTCAHVILAAKAAPGDTVHFVFHATGDAGQARIDKDLWRSVDNEDVAFLRLEGPLPAGVQAVLLGESPGSSGHPFGSFGFPDANPLGGVHGDGHILGVTHLGNVAVMQLSSSQVTPGFSGAPVLDTLTSRVIGMVTAIADPDQHGRLGETAFITPTETLRSICPELQLSDICPYRGLAAFTEEDARFFHGRTGLIGRLVDSLKRQPRFLAVLGPSGSGKSSLVQAGLVPALREGAILGSQGWEVIFVNRPTEQPFLQLASLGLIEADKDLVIAVEEWLKRQTKVTQLMLVFDQFEELLLDYDEDLLKRFIDELERLLNTPVPVTVALVLRDDFYSRFTKRASKLLTWFAGGLVNIPSELTQQELTDIVLKPAESVGLLFAVGLVEEILQDVQEAGRHTAVLPLLEFALTQLWEKRQDGMLNHADYLANGRVTGGLTRWADLTYYALDENEHLLARRILTDLVHLGNESQGFPDSRQRRRITELIRRPLEEAALRSVIQKLADARLVVTGGEEELVEIIHEALLREWGLLQSWIRDDRRFLSWRQELDGRLRSWQDSSEDQGALLYGALLSEAENWLAKRNTDLSEEELGYIQHSIDLREQAVRDRQKQIKTRMLSLGLIAVLAVLFTIAFTAWMITVYEFNPFYYAFGRGLVENQNPFIELAGGQMIFGSAEPELDHGEAGQKRIPIESFSMQQSEVSNYQYRLCRQAGGCRSDPVIIQFYDPQDEDAQKMFADYPVVYVTAFQAQEFCAWLDGDLPTSEQWERAARGLDGRTWPWGDSPPTPERANLRIGDLKPSGLASVTSFTSGGTPDEGILNLLGNAWEWTRSQAGLDLDPVTNLLLVWDGKNPLTGLVQRGGSYKSLLDRITIPLPALPTNFGDSVGFRCVRNEQK